MTVRIDHAGRIVVPKPVRDRLGLRPGTNLELVEALDGLLLKRTDERPRLVREGSLLVYAGTTDVAVNLSAAVEEDRASRIREIWSR